MALPFQFIKMGIKKTPITKTCNWRKRNLLLMNTSIWIQLYPQSSQLTIRYAFPDIHRCVAVFDCQCAAVPMIIIQQIYGGVNTFFENSYITLRIAVNVIDSITSSAANAGIVNAGTASEPLRMIARIRDSAFFMVFCLLCFTDRPVGSRSVFFVPDAQKNAYRKAGRPYSRRPYDTRRKTRFCPNQRRNPRL